MKTLSRNLLYSILFVAIFILSINRLNFIQQVAQTPSHSFISYYVASTLLMQGEEVHQYYDGEWFNQHVSKITPNIEEYYRPNPPTTALMMLPLAHLNHLDARLIWTMLTLLSVIISVIWIIRSEQLNLLYAQLAILMVLVYQPLYDNFEYAQVYGILFAIFTLLLYVYKHRYPKFLGSLLGLIVVLKLIGYLWLPLLIIKHRWKAFITTCATIIGIMVLSLPILGIQSWLTFFEMLPVHNQRPSFAVTAYQSISGFFKHQFTYHEFWNPSPLMDLSIIASIFSISVLLFLLTMTLWRSYQADQPNLTFSSLILLTLLMSPASLDYHYAIVLLPILLLIAEFRNMTIMNRILLIIGVFLLSVDYPYQKSPYDQTFLSLMAYPKLIGALLLWMVSIRLMSIQSTLYKSSSSGA